MADLFLRIGIVRNRAGTEDAAMGKGHADP